MPYIVDAAVSPDSRIFLVTFGLAVRRTVGILNAKDCDSAGEGAHVFASRSIRFAGRPVGGDTRALGSGGPKKRIDCRAGKDLWFEKAPPRQPHSMLDVRPARSLSRSAGSIPPRCWRGQRSSPHLGP